MDRECRCGPHPEEDGSQDGRRHQLSRSGRQKFNFRVQGDYSVHVRGDEQVITWLQVYEEYIAVDRIRLRSFEQHGRMVNGDAKMEIASHSLDEVYWCLTVSTRRSLVKSSTTMVV